MRPDATTLKKSSSDKARITILSEPGRQYALYAFGTGTVTLTLALPDGGYDLEWIDVLTGKSLGKKEVGPDENGLVELTSPKFKTDVAARIRRRGN